jgi:peptide/nickel transport system substrate-binding protein
MESDKEKRKQLVWEIERRLAEDSARPVIFYPVARLAGTRRSRG